jgi:hypothetical protein
MNEGPGRSPAFPGVETLCWPSTILQHSGLVGIRDLFDITCDPTGCQLYLLWIGI